MRRSLMLSALLLMPSTSLTAEDVPPADITVSDALAPEPSSDKDPFAVLGGEKLHHALKPSLGDTMDSISGVSSSGFSPGASRPIVRGKSGPRVAVLENGLHVGDVSEVGDDHGVSFDPRLSTRIEVLRGSQTLAFGSSAIGGVVNSIDESIAERKIGRKIAGDFDLSAGDSSGEDRNGSFAVKGDLDPIQWFLSGYATKTDDLDTPIGRIENSETESKGVKLGASNVWDEGFIGAALKIHSSDYGVIGHEHEEDHDEGESEHGGPDINLDQVRLEIRGRSDLNEKVLKSVRYGLAGSVYEHKEIEGNEVGTKFEKESGEATLELRHEAATDLKGGLGIQIQGENFSAEGEEAFLPPSKRFSPGVFLVEDLKITEFWSVNAGGRYEFTSVDPETSLSTRNFNSWSGSLGLGANPTGEGDYSVELTGSYAERAPQAGELFSSGAHLATQSFEVGDPFLSNEEALGVEIALKKTSGPITGSAGVFYEFFPAYIGLFGTGREEEELPVYEYRESEAEFWGFESDLRVRVLNDGGHDGALIGGLDLVRAKNETLDEWLPRTPPVRTRGGIDYRYGDFGLSILSTFAEDQKRTSPFELPTSGYVRLDADASVKVPAENNLDLEFYVTGTNLLDEEIRLHTSFTKDIAPQRGRSFLVGIRGVF